MREGGLLCKTHQTWEKRKIQSFSKNVLTKHFLTTSLFSRILRIQISNDFDLRNLEKQCKFPYTKVPYSFRILVQHQYCEFQSSLNFSITRCYTYHILTFGRLSVTFSISSPIVQISSAHEIIAFQSLHVTNIQHHLLSFILVLILWGAKSSDFT